MTEALRVLTGGAGAGKLRRDMANKKRSKKAPVIRIEEETLSVAEVAEEMLTVGQVADRIGAGVSSVRLWAKDGKFEGAAKQYTPTGGYWLIPARSLDGFSVKRRGRPEGVKNKRGKKKKDI